MSKIAIAYGAILISYLILDALWLGVISKSHYQEAIGHLMRKQYPVAPWVLFYVMYAAAILYLVVWPNQSQSILTILTSGAVLGMASYGAYNLTCYAILKDWPLNITLMDWAWGTFITAVTASAGYKALQMIN